MQYTKVTIVDNESINRLYQKYMQQSYCLEKKAKYSVNSINIKISDPKQKGHPTNTKRKTENDRKDRSIFMAKIINEING